MNPKFAYCHRTKKKNMLKDSNKNTREKVDFFQKFMLKTRKGNL